MNLDLIKQILVIAMSSSIISTATIQKIKCCVKKRMIICILSIVISFLIGILFTLSFTNLNILDSIWVGLITWVGADTIYKAFENKIFTSFSTMNRTNNIKIERTDI